jgi:nucleoside-diphosphate-sugar epimerase
MRANVVGTVTLLEATRAARVRRFVFASSSSVYGDSVTLPKHEAMEIRPLSPYAASKLAGEAYCRAYAASMGLETVALRYFNIFGPRQNPDSPYSAVIPLFVRALARGLPPTIHGDGGQTRDFTFVANAVAANLAALDAPGASGGVFNVACGERTSLVQMLSVLSELVGVSIAPRHTPSRTGDIRDSVASIDRARTVLGYAPAISLQDGLSQTVAWFRTRV